MKNIWLLIIIISLCSLSLHAQNNRFSIGLNSSLDSYYHGTFGLGTYYKIGPKSQIGLEAFYNKGTSFRNKNPRWKLGLRHEWTLTNSKKYEDLRTWYFSQFIDYGQNRLIYHSSNELPQHSQKHEHLVLGMSIGRQFNINQNLSLNAEIGINTNLYSESLYSNLNNNTYQKDIGINSGGLIFNLGLRYKIPFKK